MSMPTEGWKFKKQIKQALDAWEDKHERRLNSELLNDALHYWEKAAPEVQAGAVQAVMTASNCSFEEAAEQVFEGVVQMYRVFQSTRCPRG